MEMLVGKIFDLAFMPAMNGESGCLCLPGARGPGTRCLLVCWACLMHSQSTLIAILRTSF